MMTALKTALKRDKEKNQIKLQCMYFLGICFGNLCRWGKAYIVDKANQGRGGSWANADIG